MSDLQNDGHGIDVYELVCKGRFTHIEDDHKELKASIADIQKTQTYIMTKIENGFTSKIENIDKKVDDYKVDAHNDIVATRKDISGIRKLFLKLMFIIIVFILGLLGTFVTQYAKNRSARLDESHPIHHHDVDPGDLGSLLIFDE